MSAASSGSEGGENDVDGDADGGDVYIVPQYARAMPCPEPSVTNQAANSNLLQYAAMRTGVASTVGSSHWSSGAARRASALGSGRRPPSVSGATLGASRRPPPVSGRTSTASSPAAAHRDTRRPSAAPPASFPTAPDTELLYEELRRRIDERTCRVDCLTLNGRPVVRVVTDFVPDADGGGVILSLENKMTMYVQDAQIVEKLAANVDRHHDFADVPSIEHHRFRVGIEEETDEYRRVLRDAGDETHRATLCGRRSNRQLCPPDKHINRGTRLPAALVSRLDVPSYLLMQNDPARLHVAATCGVGVEEVWARQLPVSVNKPDAAGPIPVAAIRREMLSACPAPHRLDAATPLDANGHPLRVANYKEVRANRACWRRRLRCYPDDPFDLVGLLDKCGDELGWSGGDVDLQLQLRYYGSLDIISRQVPVVFKWTVSNAVYKQFILPADGNGTLKVGKDANGRPKSTRTGSVCAAPTAVKLFRDVFTLANPVCNLSTVETPVLRLEEAKRQKIKYDDQPWASSYASCTDKKCRADYYFLIFEDMSLACNADKDVDIWVIMRSNRHFPTHDAATLSKRYSSPDSLSLPFVTPVDPAVIESMACSAARLGFPDYAQCLRDSLAASLDAPSGNAPDSGQQSSSPRSHGQARVDPFDRASTTEAAADESGQPVSHPIGAARSGVAPSLCADGSLADAPLSSLPRRRRMQMSCAAKQYVLAQLRANKAPHQIALDLAAATPAQRFLLESYGGVPTREAIKQLSHRERKGYSPIKTIDAIAHLQAAFARSSGDTTLPGYVRAITENPRGVFLQSQEEFNFLSAALGTGRCVLVGDTTGHVVRDLEVGLDTHVTVFIAVIEDECGQQQYSCPVAHWVTTNKDYASVRRGFDEFASLIRRHAPSMPRPIAFVSDCEWAIRKAALHSFNGLSAVDYAALTSTVLLRQATTAEIQSVTFLRVCQAHFIQLMLRTLSAHCPDDTMKGKGKVAKRRRELLLLSVQYLAECTSEPAFAQMVQQLNLVLTAEWNDDSVETATAAIMQACTQYDIPKVVGPGGAVPSGAAADRPGGWSAVDTSTANVCAELTGGQASDALSIKAANVYWRQLRGRSSEWRAATIAQCPPPKSGGPRRVRNVFKMEWAFDVLWECWLPYCQFWSSILFLPVRYAVDLSQAQRGALETSLASRYGGTTATAEGHFSAVKCSWMADDGKAIRALDISTFLIRVYPIVTRQAYASLSACKCGLTSVTSCRRLRASVVPVPSLVLAPADPSPPDAGGGGGAGGTGGDGDERAAGEEGALGDDAPSTESPSPPSPAFSPLRPRTRRKRRRSPSCKRRKCKRTIEPDSAQPSFVQRIRANVAASTAITTELARLRSACARRSRCVAERLSLDQLYTRRSTAKRAATALAERASISASSSSAAATALPAGRRRSLPRVVRDASTTRTVKKASTKGRKKKTQQRVTSAPLTASAPTTDTPPIDLLRASAEPPGDLATPTAPVEPNASPRPAPVLTAGQWQRLRSLSGQAVSRPSTRVPPSVPQPIRRSRLPLAALGRNAEVPAGHVSAAADGTPAATAPSSGPQRRSRLKTPAVLQTTQTVPLSTVTAVLSDGSMLAAGSHTYNTRSRRVALPSATTAAAPSLSADILARSRAVPAATGAERAVVTGHVSARECAGQLQLDTGASLPAATADVSARDCAVPLVTGASLPTATANDDAIGSDEDRVEPRNDEGKGLWQAKSKAQKKKQKRKKQQTNVLKWSEPSRRPALADRLAASTAEAEVAVTRSRAAAVQRVPLSQMAKRVRQQATRRNGKRASVVQDKAPSTVPPSPPACAARRRHALAASRAKTASKTAGANVGVVSAGNRGVGKKGNTGKAKPASTAHERTAAPPSPTPPQVQQAAAQGASPVLRSLDRSHAAAPPQPGPPSRVQPPVRRRAPPEAPSGGDVLTSAPPIPEPTPPLVQPSVAASMPVLRASVEQVRTSAPSSAAPAVGDNTGGHGASPKVPSPVSRPPTSPLGPAAEAPTSGQFSAEHSTRQPASSAQSEPERQSDGGASSARLSGASTEEDGTARAEPTGQEAWPLAASSADLGGAAAAEWQQFAVYSDYVNAGADCAFAGQRSVGAALLSVPSDASTYSAAPWNASFTAALEAASIEEPQDAVRGVLQVTGAPLTEAERTAILTVGASLPESVINRFQALAAECFSDVRGCQPIGLASQGINTASLAGSTADRRLLQILYLGGGSVVGHFVLLASDWTTNEDDSFFVYDSLPMKSCVPSTQLFDAAAASARVQGEQRSIRIRVPKVTQQEDGSNACGLMCCYYLWLVCVGSDPACEKIDGDEEKLRVCFLECLEKADLSVLQHCVVDFNVRDRPPTLTQGFHRVYQSEAAFTAALNAGTEEIAGLPEHRIRVGCVAHCRRPSFVEGGIGRNAVCFVCQNFYHKGCLLGVPDECFGDYKLLTGAAVARPTRLFCCPSCMVANHHLTRDGRVHTRPLSSGDRRDAHAVDIVDYGRSVVAALNSLVRAASAREPASMGEHSWLRLLTRGASVSDRSVANALKDVNLQRLKASQVFYPFTRKGEHMLIRVVRDKHLLEFYAPGLHGDALFEACMISVSIVSELMLKTGAATAEEGWRCVMFDLQLFGDPTLAGEYCCLLLKCFGHGISPYFLRGGSKTEQYWLASIENDVQEGVILPPCRVTKPHVFAISL